jgi:hypothetical protein
MISRAVRESQPEANHGRKQSREQSQPNPAVSTPCLIQRCFIFFLLKFPGWKRGRDKTTWRTFKHSAHL